MLFALADVSALVLERVPGLDGKKIMQIAAGAEHSALVTGKISVHFSSQRNGPSYFPNSNTSLS